MYRHASEQAPWAQEQPASHPSGMELVRALQGATDAFDEGLNAYTEANMFDYEKLCRGIMTRTLVKQRQVPGNLRAELQKVYNHKFLQFQMKEKDIRKKVQDRSRKVEQIAEIRRLEKEGRGGVAGLPLTDVQREGRGLTMQQGVRDDHGNRYINKSRRRMVDPKAAVKAEIEQHERMTAAMVMATQEPKKLKQELQTNEYARYEDLYADARTSQQDFLNKFSVGEQHVREVKQLQGRVLEQQIREKRLKDIQEKQHVYKDYLRKSPHGQSQIERVTRWGRDDRPPAAAPQSQINYLSNSNNIHDVFGSLPGEAEREPNQMVRPPRENSKSRSRSKGYGDIDRRPILYADLQELDPVTIQQIPQKGPQLAQQDLASSMKHQAVEFIAVLKNLIEDTVAKGRQLQEMKKEQTVITLEPEQNYHYKSKEEEQAAKERDERAMEKTARLAQEIEEVQRLRRVRDEMRQEELEVRLRQEKEQNFPIVNEQHQAKLLYEKMNEFKDEQLNKARKDPDSFAGKVEQQASKVEEMAATFAGVETRQKSMFDKDVILQKQNVGERPEESSLLPAHVNPDAEQPDKTNEIRTSTGLHKQDGTGTKTQPSYEAERALNTGADEARTVIDVTRQALESGKASMPGFEKRPLPPEMRRTRLRLAEIQGQDMIEAQVLEEKMEGDFRSRKTRSKLVDIDDGLRELDEEDARLDKQLMAAQGVSVRQFKEPSIADQLKIRVTKLEKRLEQPTDDYINEWDDAINIGREQDHPKAQIAQEIINKVKMNYAEYEGTDVFQSIMPASFTPVLNPSLTDEKGGIADDALTPQEIIAGKSHDAPLMKLDHRISVAVDQAMKENFSYEQRTVKEMFDRYATMKPIVTGVYGQDIVDPAEELLGDAQSLKEMETQLLVERMKRNHRDSKIELGQAPMKLQAKEEMRNKIQLRMEEDEAYMAKLKQYRDEKEKQTKDQEREAAQEWTNKEYAVELSNKKIELPPELDVKNRKVDANDPNNIQQPGDDFRGMQIMFKSRNNQTVFDPEKSAVNIGAVEEESEGQKAKDFVAIPEGHADGFDSEAVKQRILHLKVMFDDAAELRRRQNFMENKPKLLSDIEPASDLGLVEEFNKVYDKRHSEDDAKKGSGVKDGADGSTKMISKTMAEVRSLKAQLHVNQVVDHDFTEKLAGTAPVIDPDLNAAAKEVDKSLVEHVALQKQMMLGGTDFQFNEKAYDKDKAEIERLARERLAKTDAQLADLADAKRDTLVDQIKDNPSLKVNELAESKVRRIDGKGFDWANATEDERAAEMAQQRAEESKEQQYAFMNVGRFKEKLGIVEQKELGVDEMERLQALGGSGAVEVGESAAEKVQLAEPTANIEANPENDFVQQLQQSHLGVSVPEGLTKEEPNVNAVQAPETQEKEPESVQLGVSVRIQPLEETGFPVAVELAAGEPEIATKEQPKTAFSFEPKGPESNETAAQKPPLPPLDQDPLQRPRSQPRTPVAIIQSLQAMLKPSPSLPAFMEPRPLRTGSPATLAPLPVTPQPNPRPLEVSFRNPQLAEASEKKPATLPPLPAKDPTRKWAKASVKMSAVDAFVKAPLLPPLKKHEHQRSIVIQGEEPDAPHRDDEPPSHTNPNAGIVPPHLIRSKPLAVSQSLDTLKEGGIPSLRTDSERLKPIKTIQHLDFPSLSARPPLPESVRHKPRYRSQFTGFKF